MLFDNDLTFLSIINSSEVSEKKENALYDTTEGFIKGNMFESEYKAYKSMRPSMPKTRCEKTAKLYKIMELNFAINDLNLWLDIHPEDKKIFELMKKCIEKLYKCEVDYVKLYGPLEVNENVFETNEWVKDWPWESEDSKYV